MGRSSLSHQILVEQLNNRVQQVLNRRLLTDNLVIIPIRDRRCSNFVFTQPDIKTFSKSYIVEEKFRSKDRREEKENRLTFKCIVISA